MIGGHICTVPMLTTIQIAMILTTASLDAQTKGARMVKLRDDDEPHHHHNRPHQECVGELD